ncbi:putative GPI-anchor transamidase [Blattamonas nauphoetae]|uniref:GPI-anchor transamidase n=1 Tax=Blattamonas nauphoetae TaxID=2049346 RepID=A0ABQ9X977_9EUKA|nr:putative GPI-anchor transamidase [Blattamonas nauphoetae]
MLLASLLVLTCSHLFAYDQKFDNHENNWAIVCSTSSFFFNYRHTSNPLAVYRRLKESGFPDDHILLMISDDATGNLRTPFSPNIYFSKSTLGNFYPTDIQVDYKGYEVNENNFMRLLIGSHPKGTPLNKQLLSDDKSNIFIYLTGHGGENFIKFRDKSSLSGSDLATAIDFMHQKRRFHRILFIVDTCQGESLIQSVKTPGFIGVASSRTNESAWSTEHDPMVYQSLADRFTRDFYHFLKDNDVGTDLFQYPPPSQTLAPRRTSSRNNHHYATLHEFMETLDPAVHEAQPVLRDDLLPPGESAKSVLLDDFLGYRERVTLL